MPRIGEMMQTMKQLKQLQENVDLNINRGSTI